MFGKQQFILICLVQICLYQLPEVLARSDDKLNKTSNNTALFEPFTYLWNRMKLAAQNQSQISLRSSNDGPITNDFSEYLYSDLQCGKPSILSTTSSVTGQIQTNSISFGLTYQNVDGQMSITPASDLKSFVVGITLNGDGNHQETTQIKFYGNGKKCENKDFPASSQYISMTGQACVMITDFSQVSNSQLQSCFVVAAGAAVKIDVDKVKRNVVAGGAVDVGCYLANATSIIYQGQNSDLDITKTLATALLKPIHADACGSSGLLLPSIFITVAAALVQFLLTSF